MNTEEWKYLTALVNPSDPRAIGARVIDQHPERSAPFYMHCTADVVTTTPGCVYGMIKTEGVQAAASIFGLPQFYVAPAGAAVNGAFTVNLIQHPILPQDAALLALKGRFKCVGCGLSVRTGMNATETTNLGMTIGGNIEAKDWAPITATHVNPIVNGGVSVAYTATTVAGVVDAMKKHTVDWKEGQLIDGMMVRWSPTTEGDIEWKKVDEAGAPTTDITTLAHPRNVTVVPFIMVHGSTSGHITHWDFWAHIEYEPLEEELIAATDSPYGENGNLIRQIAVKFPTVVTRGKLPSFRKIVPAALSIAQMLAIRG